MPEKRIVNVRLWARMMPCSQGIIARGGGTCHGVFLVLAGLAWAILHRLPQGTMLWLFT